MTDDIPPAAPAKPAPLERFDFPPGTSAQEIAAALNRLRNETRPPEKKA